MLYNFWKLCSKCKCKSKCFYYLDIIKTYIVDSAIPYGLDSRAKECKAFKKER